MKKSIALKTIAFLWLLTIGFSGLSTISIAGETPSKAGTFVNLKDEDVGHASINLIPLSR